MMASPQQSQHAMMQQLQLQGGPVLQPLPAICLVVPQNFQQHMQQPQPQQQLAMGYPIVPPAPLQDGMPRPASLPPQACHPMQLPVQLSELLRMPMEQCQPPVSNHPQPSLNFVSQQPRVSLPQQQPAVALESAAQVASPMMLETDGSGDEGDLPQCWHVVWCHEHCRKELRAPVYEALLRMVTEKGGRLFCVKKAKTYEAWRQRAGHRGPHLLLTDGREMKPCISAFGSADGACNAPLLTVVLTEMLKPLERVEAWLSGLQAKGCRQEVRVITGIADFEGILEGSLDQLCTPPAAEERAPTPTGATMPIATPGSFPSTAADESMSPTSLKPGQPSSPACTSSPDFMMPFAGPLSPCSPWHSPQEVEKILRAAMDQVYED